MPVHTNTTLFHAHTPAGIAKYGKGQATDDVAEAVKMILEKNIVANLPPGECGSNTL
jgi:hypothetical protein